MKRLVLVVSAALALLGCAPPARVVAPLRYAPVPRVEASEGARPRPALAAVVDASDPVSPVETLPNGLRIVVVERHDFPVVAAVLGVDRGGIDLDEPGSRAVSESTHLFSRGGDEALYEKTKDELVNTGAVWFAGQSSDAEWAGVKSAPSMLDRSIAILTERCVRAKLSRAEYDHRSSELAAYARMGNASMIAAERSILFGEKHPYGYVLPGATPLSQERAQAIHDRLYQPTQATLVVVGDVTRDQVLASASHWLGTWEGREPLPKNQAEVPPLNGPRVVVVSRRGLAQMHGAVLSRGPDASSEDALAFAVGAELVAGTASSGLFSQLREEGAAYAVQVQTNFLRAATWMAIHVSYDREQAVKGTADVLAAIERMRSGKTTDDEVLAAREPLLARWRESMATVDGAALEYTRSIALGIGTSFAVDYPARLAKVRREDVIRVAHEYLAAKSLHVVLMGEDRWLDVAPLGMGSVVNLPLR